MVSPSSPGLFLLVVACLACSGPSGGAGNLAEVPDDAEDARGAGELPDRDGPVDSQEPRDRTGEDTADGEAGVAALAATVKPNPACDLTCVVRWTTPTPASSRVEFGAGETLTHVTGSEEPVREHEVVVVGLAPDTAYTLVAASVDAGGTEARSGPLAYTTGPPPPPWMAGIVDVHDPARAFPGLTLANVITGNATNEPLVLVLLGMDGRPVWTFTGPMGSGRGDIQASWVGDRHILVGGGFEAGVRPFLMDLQGSLLWEGPEQPGGDGPVPDLLVEGTMHHVFQPVYDGTFVVLENTIRDNVIGDRIRHFDKMLKPLWIWDAFEHLPDPRTVALGQWLHSNSVVLEPATDHVLLSCMALGRIFKLSRPDGQVLWALGEGGDFQADPDAKHPWFYGGHGLKRLPDGHLLFYDNGTVKRGFSRVVEYALDEEARTATIAWEYPGTFTGETWFNGAMGDVDPLPNGNVLIAAGNGVQHQSPSRLMEVARDGTRVWQMWWYNSPNLRAGCYQVERIPPLSLPLDR